MSAPSAPKEAAGSEESRISSRAAKSAKSTGLDPDVAGRERPLDIVRPKFDQHPLVSSDTQSGRSVTHAHSTLHSEQPSLYSFVSARDISKFVRNLHGRSWNSLNESYLLPSDELEWGRLDKQHSALLIGFGGLYPCPEVIEPLLSTQDNGEPRRVLDVGCGTGSWAIEMAHRFPRALIQGIDLSPVPIDSEVFPPNLSFEIDDINEGLSHYHGQMDVIHMRCVIAGISDIDNTLDDLVNCLKPGGVLLIIDGDNQFNQDRRSYIKLAKVEGDNDVDGVSETGSWARRMLWEALESAKIAGSNLGTAEELIDNGPWDHELCDPEATVTGGVYLPIGPWATGSNPAETQMLLYAGTLMRQVFLNIHRAFHPIIRKHGMDQATLDEWSRNVEEEVSRMRHKMWVRFRFFWTRRREAEGLPAPPLPVLPPSNDAGPSISTASDNDPSTLFADPSSDNIPRYPAIEFFRTREEAMTRAAERKASMGTLPRSAVERVWLSAQAL